MGSAARKSATRKRPARTTTRTKTTKATKSVRSAKGKKAVKNQAKAAPVESSSVGFMRETVMVALLVLALFLSLALYSYLSIPEFEREDAENFMGPVGHSAAELLVKLFGWCSVVTVLWALLLAHNLWRGAEDRRPGEVFVRILAACVMAASCAVIASVAFGYRGGGEVGSALAYFLIDYVAAAGAVLLSLALFLLSLGMTSDFGPARLFAALGATVRFIASLFIDAGYVIATCAKSVFGGIGRSAGAFARACKAGLSSLMTRSRENLEARRARREEDLEGFVQGELEEVEEEESYILGDEEEVEEEEDYEDDEYEEDEDEYEEEDEYEDDEFDDEDDEFELDAPVAVLPPKISRREPETSGSPNGRTASKISATEKPVRQTYADFELPPVDLLVSSERSPETGPQDADLIENSQRLEQALANFRIAGRVVEVHPGPVVTLYQLEPGPGVKVQRVINLADDLALALRVGSVRVYAPVPGKGTVGIEVPNAGREIVRLRDVLESPEFRVKHMPLGLGLGKDTFGEPYIADLAKMPHLLIAGATGTGKSVCINSILASLLFRNTPDDLRLLLIDPKMLELSIYEEIPHLKAPVVTVPRKARGVLWWAVEEMERRYRLMKQMGVRDLEAYNRAVAQRFGDANPPKKKRKNAIIRLEEKDVVATGSPYDGLDRTADYGEVNGKGLDGAHERLPRIVIVVDELADLMLTVGREIEELLTRLAQKARASGIHLILATQRPSVNVITGLIKANFPARVSFKVASKIDARTVMDSSGAEKLLGQGDMLFMSPSVGRVLRLHSPYISDKEVHDVVDWLKEQGMPDYDEDIEKMVSRIEESDGGGKGPGLADGSEEYDQFYDQAVQLVVEKGQASTSMVQRAFRIGYNRAARILETMEREGIVGPADGAKPRQVLLAPSEDMI